jgi:hypothetical protein
MWARFLRIDVSKTKQAAKLFSREWKAILAEPKLIERAMAAQNLYFNLI